MRIAIAAEADPSEPRVAGTPETVKKLKALGAEVAVARGAGVASGILDADYEAAGATVSDNVSKDADVVLKVRRPGASELAAYKKGALVIAIMDPYGNEAALKQMADAGIVAFAMELMPRITRAQSMDVLSSQANLAGYRAVIDAAGEYGRALPMMMTAAGWAASLRRPTCAPPPRSRWRAWAPSSWRSRTRSSRTRRRRAATPRRCRKSTRPSRPPWWPSTSRSRTSSSPRR